ncbi:MAG: hypothetical protein Q9165_000219 [Trypethelium subeluteriae]
MAETETEDERDIELDSIKAIFEELQTDPNSPYTVYLDIPVSPEAPLPIIFPAVDGAPPNQLPTPPSSDHDSTVDNEPRRVAAAIPLEIHRISNLPPLKLKVYLPERYPADEAPQFSLSSEPHWIPEDTLEKLQWNGLDLWHEYGHGQVVFAYIDQLQQSAERAFGLAVDGPLSLPQEMQIALLDFDRQAERRKFEAETFDCGVCLEPKKGASCHRITRCGHVFCVSCLQDFYNNCITEGDISSVKCLAPDCGADKPRGRKPKTLSPSQLLQIPLEPEMVRRYVDLKRKKKLESDSSTVYCPRKWCQGPARSKKYPKLTDVTAIDSSDSSDDEAPTEPPNSTSSTNNKNILPPLSERLAICSLCQYAFCRICSLGWHGEYARCHPLNAQSAATLSAEDQASMEYIRLHTSPCPTCGSPCQKTHGCNHMRCFQCGTHFCYLCSAWLDAANPYQHFAQKGRGCYMRLWELEEGDNGQGAAFGGVRMAEQEAFAIEQQALEDEAVGAQGREGGDEAVVVVRGVHVDENGREEDEWYPPAPPPPRQAEVPAVVALMNRMNLEGRDPQQEFWLQRREEVGFGHRPALRRDRVGRRANRRFQRDVEHGNGEAVAQPEQRAREQGEEENEDDDDSDE